MRRLLIPVAAAMSAMTAPTRRTPTPEEIRLGAELAEARAQLRDVRARLAAQEEQLLNLQTANERVYQADYDATGGPRFDKDQPATEGAV